MNTISEHGKRQIDWSATVMSALGFWLSSSLLLDSVVIPGLVTTGMMSQTGFASVGYTLFGTFNHIEVICAAIVLTGCLAARQRHYCSAQRERWSIGLASVLLTITLIYTYWLTPQLSGWGFSIDPLFNQAMPQAMMMMQAGYWGLEVIKFLAGVTLLRWYYRNSCTLL